MGTMKRGWTSRRGFAVVGTVLLLSGFGIACAQSSTNPPTDASRVLSLADAERIAFERNWDLLAAKTGVDLASAQRIIAHEFPNLTASWSTAKIGTHENGTDLGNNLWERSYDSIAAIN